MQLNVQRALWLVSRRQFPFRLAGSTGRLSSMRRRWALVRSLEQLLDRASRYPPSQFLHPDSDVQRLLQTRVVLGCRSALLAIKDALADQRQPITAAALRQLETFLSDPSASPLFGDNPYTAQHAARELQQSFTRQPSRGSLALAAFLRTVLYRSVTVALAAAGVVLVAIGIAYLVTPTYGLPWPLPHDDSLDRNVKVGSAANLGGALCFLGARLTRQRAVKAKVLTMSGRGDT